MNSTAKFIVIMLCAIPHLSFACTSDKKSKASNIVFIENKGQITDQYHISRTDIDVKLNAPGIDIFIGNGQIHYQWVKEQTGKDFQQQLLPGQPPTHPASTPIETYRMDVVLEGASKNAMLVKEDMRPYYEQYYYPQTGEVGVKAHSYQKLVYENVYPAIDWVLYLKDGSLKYDFIVHPGGNPQHIKLKYNGATNLALKEGALAISTPLGTITEHKPYTYDQQSGRELSSAYVLDGNTVRFNIAPNEGTTIIDPVIYWATYYGGSGIEGSPCVAADAAGNSYLGGNSSSTANIATTGAFKTTVSSIDGFIAKFDSEGVRQWGTYYGGAGADLFYSLHYDVLSGNIYASGYTESTTGIATGGAHQTAFGGVYDAMLVKFSNTGSRIWATYYGGADFEWESYVECDNAGNVYLGGETRSTSNIATAGTFQTVSLATPTSADGYLVKFNSAGVRQWCTYFGGTEYEVIKGVACDAGGGVYLGGYSSSPGLASPGAHQTTIPLGYGTAILAKFNSGNGTRIWSTYHGGNFGSDCYGIDCDASGNIYIGGYTHSTTGISTPGSYQPTLNGGTDLYIAKLNSAGVKQWGTYYGGSNAELFGSVLARAGTYVYLNGVTNSIAGIALPNAHQQGYGGGPYDAFVVQINPSNGFAVRATYFGGLGDDDHTLKCAYSSPGYLYVPVRTNSGSMATPDSHQEVYGGSISDALLGKFIVDTLIFINKPYIDTVLCAGDTINLGYWLSYDCRAGNTFTVQLSNASGSFVSPVTIGSSVSSVQGFIQCIIPASITSGNGYRIRIISSEPVRTSDNNGVNIRLKEKPANVSATNNGPVCSGTTLNLAGASTTTGVTYSWTGPNSFTSGVQNPAITNVPFANGGDYILTVSNDGCKVLDTTTAVVKETPAIPVVNSNSPVCPGHTISLTSSSTTSGATYAWAGPSSFTSAVQNPGISNAATSHAGIYSVTASLNGCTSAAGTTNVLVQITTATPIANSNSPVCQGGSLDLTATGAPGTTYSWTGPNGYTSTAQNPSISPAQVFHSGNYIVVATLANCTSLPDTVTTSVTYVASLGAYISPNDTICPGAVVNFVAMSNAIPPPSFQWYKNLSPIPGASNAVHTTSAIANGDAFYCTAYITGIPTCQGAITISTDTMSIVVHNIKTVPQANITSNPATPLPGQQIAFQVNIVNGGQNPTYQWQRNGKDVSGAIYANWSTSNLAPYEKINCVVTSSDACANPKTVSTDTIEIKFATSADDHINNVSGVALYPNPNTGTFTLSGLQANKQNTLTIINSLGQLVYTDEIKSTNHDIIISLPQQYANGTYLLRIYNGIKTDYIKFMLNR